VTKKNIAIILARGGSKRLPKKNILDFGGKPIIAWTIDATLNSKVFDKILVSTDDKEIAKISLDYGAEVPFLRDKNSDDYAMSSHATHTALNQAEKYWNIKFDFVTQLMANCPLRTSKDIKESVKFFYQNEFPAQLSCFKFGWMNPWWAFKYKDKKNFEHLFPEVRNKRSQDLPNLFCPSGAIWIAERDLFQSNKDFRIPGYNFKTLDWTSSVDIDNEDDFLMAKIILDFKMRKNKI